MKMKLLKDKYGYRIDGLNFVKASGKKWHKLRQGSIGGSDSAGIANTFATEWGLPNFTSYQSPLTVYNAKVFGQKEVTSPAIERGIRREAGLRKVSRNLILQAMGVGQKSGVSVKIVTQKYTYTKNVLGINLGANLDGLVVIESDEGIEGTVIEGLEIKTGNQWVVKDWANGNLPASYYCQVQHYMLVTGLRAFWVLAEIGDELLVRYVEKNQEFIDKLLVAYNDFKECLINRTPPLPLGLPCEKEQTEKPQLTPNYKFANDLEPIVIERQKLDEQIKLLEASKDAIDAQLKQAIGEDEGLSCGAYEVSYKQSKASVSFDKARFEKEQAELYKNYCVEKAGSRRLLIKNITTKKE